MNKFEIGDIIKIKKSTTGFMKEFQIVVDILIKDQALCKIINSYYIQDKSGKLHGHFYVEFFNKYPELEKLINQIIDTNGRFGSFSNDSVEFFKTRENKNILLLTENTLELVKKGEDDDEEFEDYEE